MIGTDKTMRCDSCHLQIPCVGKVNLIYDACEPCTMRWGWFCRRCFLNLECRLGTGKGQKYGVGPDKVWVKVAG